MKVYEQELFDAVEVSQLKAGDTITAGGEEVKITKIEEIKTGGVAINGGYDNGGITLFPGDGGTYYQVKENDAKTYQEVGTATLPLGDKFELLDNAKNDNKKLTAQDMTTLKDDGTSFNVNNTTATVENGVHHQHHQSLYALTLWSDDSDLIPSPSLLRSAPELVPFRGAFAV